MLTVELKINTELIAHIYILNRKNLGNDRYEYEYTYYEPGKEIIKGKVIHLRSEKAVKLVSLILEQIEKSNAAPC